MNVVDNLRKPFLPKQMSNRFRLFQIKHEPIAIIIMAGVVMIEFWRLASFVRRAESLAIPIGDNVHAVGIRRRDQDQNRIAQNR